MPVSGYFKGHGDEVMAGMRKRHGKRAEEMFYRTANKKGMKPKSHMPAGATQSPKGNLGDRRVAEADAQRGFANHGGKLSGERAFGSDIGENGRLRQ